MGVKTCTKCGHSKQMSDFHKHKTGKDGLKAHCKLCVQLYKKTYNITHKEQIGAYNRAYRVDHQDEVSTRKAKWRVNNRDRIRNYNLHWQRANQDKVHARNARWEKKHVQQTRAKCHRRRACKLGAEGSYTAADIERIRMEQGGRCCYCGQERKLTVDHIVPLARGGTNWPDNIALACLICNDSKGAKLPREWFVVVGNPMVRRPSFAMGVTLCD